MKIRRHHLCTPLQDDTSQSIHYILRRMELQMSALTDQIDAALATLAQTTSNVAANLAAAEAATAAVQAELDTANATIATDEAALQRALDAVNNANAALTPPAPAPVDPSVPPPAF